MRCYDTLESPVSILKLRTTPSSSVKWFEIDKLPCSRCGECIKLRTQGMNLNSRWEQNKKVEINQNYDSHSTNSCSQQANVQGKNMYDFIRCCTLPHMFSSARRSCRLSRPLLGEPPLSITFEQLHDGRVNLQRDLHRIICYNYFKYSKFFCAKLWSPGLLLLSRRTFWKCDGCGNGFHISHGWTSRCQSRTCNCVVCPWSTWLQYKIFWCVCWRQPYYR